MRVAAPLLALLAVAPALRAWPASPRSFANLNEIPVVAVGTVEEVIELGEMPAGERRFPWEDRRFEARLVVRRVFSGATAPPIEVGSRLTIHYANPEIKPGGGYSDPPVIVDLQSAQTYLFPLVRSKGLWTLERDPTWNPVVAALASPPSFSGPPDTPAGFVFRELAHVLAHGTARQRSQVAAYLASFAGDVPDELPQFLTLALGRDDDVWLEAGCAFLGVLGVPRNNPELVYGEASPPFHDVRHLIIWLLWKGDRREYPNRLIRCLLRNAPAYAWGAAVTLVDFKDSTVLIDGLNAAMHRDQPGSMTVAHFIVNAGQRGVLPEALELARRIVDRITAAPFPELQAAAQLTLKEGSERQFEALVSLLARWKQEDEKRYRALWSATAYGQNPRELRLAAILIDDRRYGFGALRYCDAAAGDVQMISGLKFGLSQDTSVEDRDRVVARAAAWLRDHSGNPR
jgi:hypothetical protein